MNTRVVGLFGLATAAAKLIVRSNSPLFRIKLLAASRIASPPHEAGDTTLPEQAIEALDQG